MEFMYIEVGVMQLGKVVNYPVACFEKGQEENYFKLGESIIIVLLAERRAKIDSDILKYSMSCIEPEIEMREKIRLAM